MEIYKRFLEDKPLMLKMLKSGERTHHEIISNLEKRYNVTDKARDLINGLNKLPQDQTVNEWLAEYSIS